MEQSVLFGLKQGSAVLKQLNAEMDLNAVEKLMDETAEGIAYQEEVSALLSSRISAADEEDVLEELAKLQAEQVSRARPERGGSRRLTIPLVCRSSCLPSPLHRCRSASGPSSKRRRRRKKSQSGSPRDGRPCWREEGREGKDRMCHSWSDFVLYRSLFRPRDWPLRFASIVSLCSLSDADTANPIKLHIWLIHV